MKNNNTAIAVIVCLLLAGGAVAGVVGTTWNMTAVIAALSGGDVEKAKFIDLQEKCIVELGNMKPGETIISDCEFLNISTNVKNVVGEIYAETSEIGDGIEKISIEGKVKQFRDLSSMTIPKTVLYNNGEQNVVIPLGKMERTNLLLKIETKAKIYSNGEFDETPIKKVGKFTIKLRVYQEKSTPEPTPTSVVMVTLNPASPSGTSTPGANSIIAIFQISNSGNSDIVVKQINFSKRGADLNGVLKVYNSTTTLLNVGTNWKNNESQASLVFIVPSGVSKEIYVRMDTEGAVATDTFQLILKDIIWNTKSDSGENKTSIVNIQGGILTY